MRKVGSAKYLMNLYLKRKIGGAGSGSLATYLKSSSLSNFIDSTYTRKIRTDSK